MMSYLSEINSEIKVLDRWQRSTLASVCAESLSPVIVRMALPVTRQVFEEGLNAIWKSVQKRTMDTKVNPLRCAVDTMAESNCDDSHVPAFQVMSVLGVLAYALETIAIDDSRQTTSFACTAAADYYGGIDAVLTYGNKTRIIDPRNPPPPGPLELKQIKLQFQVIGAMRQVSQSQESVVQQLRKSVSDVASELEKALEIYIAKRCWR